jgi:hypothetical protein
MPRSRKTSAIRAAALAASMLTLAACSSGTPQLMNLRNTETGPDEFGVLPSAPLEMPDTFAELPEPAPGARNRADPDPEGAAIAALGGNAGRAAGGSTGLVSHVTRFGISPDIRPVLAAEDEEFRRRNDGRILERVFGTNVYFEAYRVQALDRYAELERLRRMGVRTPAAPPPAE